MAIMNFSSMSLLSLSLLLRLLWAAKCQVQPAPALYVFGDSLVDSGNSNYLDTIARGNFEPYGIDFSEGSTGRFTNGKTIADFIAENLNLPYATAYLSLPKDPGERSRKTMTGLNYAAAAAGIRPETGIKTGETLTFEKQISYFNSTIQNDLPMLFKTVDELQRYLAKSIFIITMGTNDYINNYLQPEFYNSSKGIPPDEYADQLVDGLKQHLTKLYNLGARKILVFGLAPVGCLPGVVNSVTPRPSTPCEETVNSFIKFYNGGLPDAIQQLSSSLQGSNFVLGDIFKTIYDHNQDPFKFGYTDGRTPCCVVGGNGTTTCIPRKVPCQERDTHLWWDAFHPVSHVNRDIASGCFNGSSPCVPINILELAQR